VEVEEHELRAEVGEAECEKPFFNTNAADLAVGLIKF
jgi:hypothetical protein